MTEQTPIAIISKKPTARLSAAWIIPILASVVAIVLLFQWLRERGPEVTIVFENAQGLTTDAPVMYRGAIVGRIERVQLNNDTSKIVVTARLNASAQDLARQGTLWWIVRPEVSLEGISGLDTLISPRYLTLSPGQGEPLFNFEGTPSSMIANKHLAGVGFTLITDSITGITLGTPLYYRGIIVGTVGNIQFAPDSVAVLIDIIVKNEFSNLIRTNTKFWQVSGFDFDIGFTGVSMNIGPVSSLLKGGIQLATPQDPGEIAHEGYGFILDEEMDEEWLEWAPKLPLLRDLNAK